ncbi:MAG: hypothetical protein ACLT3K_03220 [Bacteroides ovatus]|uniref:hypothetical protein n=1 Tax=Bacteroides sp. TaxID=29523 RepID=UPI002AB2BE95|nr:hypothetical protein [Bacteroides ovatus]
MKKYIVYLILCFVSCLIFSCTSVYENGDTSCIPEGMERLTFKVIVPSSKVVGSNTRNAALERENEIKDLFVKIGYYDGGHYRNFYSTQNGTIHFDSYAYEDSIYRASIEVPVGTFRDGDNIYVWANQEYPIEVTLEEELTTPLYMSGIGTIRDRWGGGRDFETDVHLLRGVAKLRTVVRTTKRSVMGSWRINMDQVETQLLYMPSCIRPFAPFETHRNPTINESWNNLYCRYIDCSLRYNYWWLSSLLSSVELPIDDGVNVDKVTETSYDRYIYENWLENESEYDENANVTALKVRIPLWNNETGENRIIERVIPIKTNDSYRILRNHIYTVDIRVLSLDEVKIFTDMLDWEDVGVTGNIVGGADFDIDKKEITLIKDIVDPVKLVKVDCHAPGHLQIRVLKSNKTDLMSTNDLQLYYNGITETDKLVDNSGIYDLTAAQIMNFYCTTGSVPANYEGGFIEISSDNVHVEYIPISSLDTFTPLDTEGTANSYIVDRGAASYSFTAAIMGNGVDGIIDEGNFEDASGNILTKAGGANIHPLSAKLLWQDTDELVEQVALVNGRVQVKMGRSRGNAVIAVYDKANPNAEDAKVLWSWHLWCTATPKILEFVTSIYTGNNYKVMDRNLGATATKAYLGTVQGLHYQWGRKDPFSGSLAYDGIRTILYDVRSGQVVYKYSDERVTVNQAISTPNSFYTPLRKSWCTKTTDLKYLWGNPDGEQDVFPKETLKSLYDPCPYGYKVAPHDVFKILSKGEVAIFPEPGMTLLDMYFIKSYFENGSTFYYDNAGTDETKLIYLPETYAPDATIIRLGKRGVYWCSSPHPANKENNGLMFNFHIYPMSFFEYNIYNAVITSSPASIRCVKE